MYVVYYLYKGKERKKGCAKSNAEINWNTEYKSKAYKHTIKMIAKITKYIKVNQMACFCSKNSWLAYESWPLVPSRLYHMTNKRKGGLHK